MINQKNLSRGSIWFVDLDPTIGHEQAKKRPCVVISADLFNQGRSGLVVVIPMTSTHRELYWHIKFEQSQSGLSKTSYIMCDQIRTVSIERFSVKCIGFVTDYVLEQIEERLRVLLHLI